MEREKELRNKEEGREVSLIWLHVETETPEKCSKGVHLSIGKKMNWKLCNKGEIRDDDFEIYSL